MKINKIMIVSIVLLAVMTLGAVSAADGLAADETQDSLELSVDDTGIIADGDDDDGGETDEEPEGDLDDKNQTEKVDPEITARFDEDEYSYGDVAWVSVELPEDATGEVTVFVNGKFYDEWNAVIDEYWDDWDDEYYIETFSGFDYTFDHFGTTTLKIDYSGDEKYLPASTSVEYTLNNTEYNVFIPDDWIRYGTDVVYLVPPNGFTAELIVVVKGEGYTVVRDWIYDDEMEEDVEAYYFDASILDLGDNEITVMSPGDDVFGPYERNETLSVYSWIDFPDSVTWGNPEDGVSVLLPEDANGTLTVFEEEWDDEEEDMVEVIVGVSDFEDGLAFVPLSNLTIGYHFLGARYEGNYETMFGDDGVYVSPAFLIPRVVVRGDEAYVSVQGSEDMEGTLRVSVDVWDDETDDEVTIELDPVDVVDGFAQVALPDLDFGSYYVYAELDLEYDSYSDSGYVYVENSTECEVAVDCPEAIVSCSGEVEVGIILPGYATGDLALYIDDEFIYSINMDDDDYYGYLTFVSNDFEDGTHTLNVTFTSDEFGVSSDAAEFEITPVVIYIPNEIVYNDDESEDGTIWVDVQDSVKGTATVLIDDEEYDVIEISDDDECESYESYIKGIPLGEHNITVTYSGNNPTVTKSKLVNMSYKINILGKYLEYGDDEDSLVFISVPYDLGDGEFTVTIDGVEYDDFIGNPEQRSFSVNASGLDYGDHEIIVNYSGDEIYPAQEVNDTITVSSSIHIPYYWSEGAEVYLLLPEDATGTLTVNVTVEEERWDDEEGEEYWVHVPVDYKEIPLENGYASYLLDELGYGEYFIECRYIDGNYAVDDASEWFTMKPNVYWNEEVEYNDGIPVGENATIYIESTKGDTFTVTVSKFLGYEWDEEEWEDVPVYETIFSENIPLEDGKANYTFALPEMGDFEVFYELSDEEELIYADGDDIASTPLEVDIPYEINLADPGFVRVVMPEDTAGNITVEFYFWENFGDEDDGEGDWMYIDNFTAAFENGEAVVDIPDFEDEGNYCIELYVETENYGNYYDRVSWIEATWGERPEGEGDEIEASFEFANAANDDIVVCIPKQDFPEDDVADNFTVSFEGKTNVVKLSEIEQNDEFYYIKVSDLAGDFTKEETYGGSLLVQFYDSNGEPNYYAQSDDEAELIYNSPYISGESEVLFDKNVVVFRDVPLDSDEIFTVTAVTEGAEPIVTKFNSTELENIDEEGGFLAELYARDLNITEPGVYNVTVTFTKDGEFLKNFTGEVEMELFQIFVKDEDEDGRIIASDVSDTIFTLRVNEDVTGYVKVEVNGAQVGDDIALSDLPYGGILPAVGREIMLNNFNITESGKYHLSVKVYRDDDELLGEDGTPVIVEVTEDTVEFNSVGRVHEIEDIFSFQISNPVSADVCYNIYLNGELAGNYTLEGLEISDAFTEDLGIYDKVVLKVGDYKANVTCVENGAETDFATGEFSVKGLANLTADKEYYLADEDVTITFAADEPTTGTLRVYWIAGWGVFGREDEQLINTIRDEQLLEIWNNGTFTIKLDAFGEDAEGEMPILVEYTIGEDDFHSDYVLINITNAVDPGLGVFAADIHYGIDAAILVTANESFTHNVTVQVDGKNYTVPVINGEGILTVSNLTVGRYIVVATSEAFDLFLAGEANTTFEVDLAVPEITILTGEAIEISGVDVEVNIDGATGNITINGQTVPLVDGKANTTIENLTPGEFVIDVNYPGDDRFANASKSLNITVKARENPGLEVNASDITVGENETITFTLNKNATGTLRVEVGNGIYEPEIVNGTAALTIADLAVGEYEVTAKYSGDKYFSEANATAAFKVEKISFDPTTDPFTPVESNDPTYTINLPSDATGNLTITIGNKSDTKALVNGTATVEIKELAPGEYEAVLSFSGDGKYLAFNKTVTVTVKVDPRIDADNVTVRYLNTKDFTATVYGIDGKPAANTPVVFKVDGVAFATVNTDANGTAKFAITQTPGKYNVTVEALGVNTTSQLTVKHVLKLKKAKVKKSAKKLVLTAKVKKINGKYPKGKKVKFKFNGKKFKAKINKKGVAKLTIKSKYLKKLKVGKKVKYQASYKKDVVKKSVKVKK